MRKLLVTNSAELNASLLRYLRFCGGNNVEISRTFADMFTIPREILEMDLVIVEAYRILEKSIDDYGLDIFLSFIRMGKKGMLIYNQIQDSRFKIEGLLFRVPGEMNELSGKLVKLGLEEKVQLSEEDVKLLKTWFPFRVVKNHHKRQHEDFNR